MVYHAQSMSDKILDKEYLLLISPQLKRFHQTSQGVWNFRCPFCGDSEHSTSKARGYVYDGKSNGLVFFCHNCGEGGGRNSIYKLLNRVNPSIANEYTLRRFTESEKRTGYHYTPNLEISTFVENDLNLASISALPSNHEAVKYMTSRRIPTEKWADLYYTDDFADYIATNFPSIDKKLQSNEKRIVIPLRNQSGQLIGVQGNSLYSIGLKYIIIQLVDEPLYYNIDKIDFSKPVLIFEGAYDSMFFENSMATLSSSALRRPNIDNSILVFDNEPRNKQIVHQMEKAVDNGKTIVVWPKSMEYKDINEMIINNYSPNKLLTIINDNAFSGLRAKLEIAQWKN